MEDQILGRVHVYAIFRKERPRENFIELCLFFMFTGEAKLFKFGNDPGKNFIELCLFFSFTDEAKLFKFGNKQIIHRNVFLTELGYAWGQTTSVSHPWLINELLSLQCLDIICSNTKA